MAKPLIAYPGAKWKFYNDMVEYFPTDMEVFIEPFLGGGSVTLSVSDDPRFSNLKRMIAGDLAPEMWAFWTGVRDNPKEVEEIATDWFRKNCPTHETLRSVGIIASKARTYAEALENKNIESLGITTEEANHQLEVYNQSVAEADKFWEWTQSVDTSKMSIPERAARILLVNKMSFSGLGDSGSLSKDRFTEFHLDRLSGIHETSKLLKRVEIYNVSFEETMKYAWENPSKTFVFLDPPYANQEKSGLYGRNGDTHRGFPHQKFAEVTKSLPCKWFVTYDDSIIVRKLFSGNTASGEPCNLVPYVLKSGYTMALRASEDALNGEELFIMNYNIEDDDEEVDF